MFQSWFIELISVLSDIIVGLSALAVPILGIIGLYQWKRELTGKIKFDVARVMAKKALQYRDEIKRATGSFTFPSESAERERKENENPSETLLLNEYYARHKRLIPLQETLRELYELSWEAEILIDENITSFLTPLEQLFGELFASTEAYFHTMIESVNKPRPVMPDDWIQEHHQRIYGIDDNFSERIDAAVNNLTEELKTILK